MEFVFSYKEQIKNKTTHYQSDIFNAYCALNIFLNNNNRKYEDIEDDSKYYANKYKELHKEFDDITQKLMTEMNRLLSIKELDFLNEFDGVVFLIGDLSIDSHGMVVTDKSYLLIDVLNYYFNKDKYNPTSFLLHELVHPVHYKANQAMYFENYNSGIEKITKRMILEGIATFLTRQLCDETDSDVFWLGYLEASQVKKWIEHAEQRRKAIGAELKLSIINDNYDSNFSLSLFSILDPDKLWEGRIAYYYGFKIIEAVYESKSIDEILHMTMDDFMPYMVTYFN